MTITRWDRPNFSRAIAVGVCAIVLAATLASCSTGEPSLVRGESSGQPAPADIGALRDLQASFRYVAETVLPAVVRVDVSSRVRTPGFPFDQFGVPDDEEPGQREFQQEGLGSGVIVSRNGREYFVLTNDHVVGEADTITVVLDDETELTADLVGRDSRKDLA